MRERERNEMYICLSISKGYLYYQNVNCSFVIAKLDWSSLSVHKLESMVLFKNSYNNKSHICLNASKCNKLTFSFSKLFTNN